MASNSSVIACRKVAAEKRTAHQGGAAGLSHLGRGGDGAAALVSLLLALVSAGNNEHGGTVGSGNTGSTQGDGSSGSLLSARLVTR